MVGFPFDSQVEYDPQTGDVVFDRAVSSQPMRKLIRDLFTTGVMPNPSDNLQVSAGTDGMTVQVQAGFAVVDGGLCQEAEIRTLEVTAADNTYDRIDTVILRWNENVDVRTADLYIKAGTPAQSPVRPELQRNNSIYEIGLADVFVTKRVATITNDKITDTRYESERCGIVSSVSEWDTTTIYQQVQADLAEFKSEEQAEFLAWFETIQNILDENIAAHIMDLLTTSNEKEFNFSYDSTTQKYGYTIDGTFYPFKTAHTLTKTITTKGTTDMGEDHEYRYVDTTGVANVNTETYTATTRAASVDMGASNAYRYVNTNGVPNSNSGTYKPTARKNNNDMGATNSYRYVDTTAVPNANSGTYSVTSNGTKDMGATNSYRYVSVSVPNRIVSANQLGSQSTSITAAQAGVCCVAMYARKDSGVTATYSVTKNGASVYSKTESGNASYNTYTTSFNVASGDVIRASVTLNGNYNSGVTIACP